MKQSHVLRCETVPIPCGSPPGHPHPPTVARTKNISAWISKEIQERLDKGWTLRAAPTVDGVVYLVFVCKEAR